MPGAMGSFPGCPRRADRTQPADLDSAGRPRASMGACRSRTNADEVQEVAVHVESLRGHLPLRLALQLLSGPRGERISLEVADMRDRAGPVDQLEPLSVVAECWPSADLPVERPRPAL